MRTESRVISPQLPPSSNVNSSGLLQVEVVDSGAAGLHLKTYYSERNSSAPTGQLPGSQVSESAAPDKLVEVSIASNGSATQIKGFDQLSPAQQFAWNDWLAHFTSPLIFPKPGIHTGQKWKTLEPETNPSPIGALSWKKNYQYVRDEPCTFEPEPPKTSPAKSSTSNQACVVIFVQSILRQKSSPKDSTPDDYKLRNLKTRGTAAGRNETILYFSRATGLLVRSTEDAQQSMEVLVALADNSNAVHYTLEAKSHSEIHLLPDSPQSAH